MELGQLTNSNNDLRRTDQPPSKSRDHSLDLDKDVLLYPTNATRPGCEYASDSSSTPDPEYFYLIPTCIDFFVEHIYPIMPLVYLPALKELITRPLKPCEKNLVYSLCALTLTHMSEKTNISPSPENWDAAAQFFLNECILVRQSYDFVGDKSFSAISSSYFISTAFFELNQNRKSWYYLREAMTMGQDIGFHDENTYLDLSPEDALCCRRTFWILYVTER